MVEDGFIGVGADLFTLRFAKKLRICSHKRLKGGIQRAYCSLAQSAIKPSEDIFGPPGDGDRKADEEIATQASTWKVLHFPVDKLMGDEVGVHRLADVTSTVRQQGVMLKRKGNYMYMSNGILHTIQHDAYSHVFRLIGSHMCFSIPFLTSLRRK